MKHLWKIFSSVGSVICIFLLHVTAAFLLPEPWSSLNIVLSLFVVYLVITGERLVVWATFFVYFLVELYTITPFGATILSATVAMLCTYWLYQNFFTNRSWYAATFLTSVSVTLYRATLYLWLLCTGHSEIVAWYTFLVSSLYEIFITVAFVLLLYGILMLCSKKLRTRDIHA